MPTTLTPSRPGIPLQHSSTTRRPRVATSQARPDVDAADLSTVQERSARLERTDSTATTRTLRKPRSHSRFASLGRIKSRPSILQRAFGDSTEYTAAPETRSVSAAQLPIKDIPAPKKAFESPARPESIRHSSNSSDSTLQEKDNLSLYSEKDLDSPKATFWLASGLDRDDRQLLSRGDFDNQRFVAPRPSKMHQTSSRLLRMTEDDRPFTRDFKDLFSTLMVSLPLTPHRVRFSRIEHTFTTEEAITNLGSLKFSQSNRMPDPKDPTRIVTTTTTTTFSMAKEMARSVCMRFLEARFVESVDGKTDFTSKSSVWQLTPKGMHILARFCQRNGIHQRHVNELLDSPRNMMQLVILERESDTDKLNHDRATIEVLFRRFVGDVGPNLKSNSTTSDSDSLNDYATGLMGVKMTRSRRMDKDVPYTFTGKAAFDWLMDCCTVVDKREVFELANLFLHHELVILVSDSNHSHSSNGPAPRFAASKNAHYAVTDKGMRTAGWITSPNGSVNGDATTASKLPTGVARDSNTNRMTIIIRDPALRLLFREFLRETHCEENLSFYLEVKAFLSDYELAKRSAPNPRLDVIRETLASAYSLYNAFLAPGSPCELNIDHNLRNALAGRMTRAVGEDEAMIKSLDEVAVLFDQAQSSVFKLMSSDSVPKFSREGKYANVLRDRNLEHLLTQFSSTSIS